MNQEVESEIDSDTEFESVWERVSDEDVEYMYEHANRYIDDYVSEHVLAISSPNFYTKLIAEVSESLLEEWNAIGVFSKNTGIYDIANFSEFFDAFFDEIREWVCALVEVYAVSWLAPPLRQEPTVSDTVLNLSETVQRLERVLTYESEKQRTPEWYHSRHNLLTASNLWKVFGTPSQYNSLIYEKCRPMDTSGETFRGGARAINPDSDNPMNHGIKYEPISISMYQRRYGTRVSDVGCVPHATYNYIGASPDGINAVPTLPRYGRMIEVKNVVNREITGVPLEAYWIQMQLQMEACDLDECDFIETRIREFDEAERLENFTKLPYTDEGESHDTPRPTPAETGMILYFIPRITMGYSYTDSASTTETVEYAYLPLEIDPGSDEAVAWIDAEKAKRPRHVLYRKSYWVLDQFSCVLVRRNRAWFAAAQPKIAEAWNTILAEREAGYEHRAAATKKKRTEVVCSDNTTTHYIKNMPLSNNICLVKLDA